MKKTAACFALLLTIVTSACSSTGQSDPAATVTVTETMVVTETVTAAADPSPTISPTREAEPSGHIGMVWASQVDPGRINQPGDSQPTFDGGDGIAVRIESIIRVDTAVRGSMADSCLSQIKIGGRADDTHCLFVQWSFDVPADYKAERAGLAPDVLLTPEGRQIEQGIITDGVPGAKSVVIVAYYPGGEPGSTVRWSVGSNELDWKVDKFEIPASDAFLPITFN